jgi:hypothetical protein
VGRQVIKGVGCSYCGVRRESENVPHLLSVLWGTLPLKSARKLQILHTMLGSLRAGPAVPNISGEGPLVGRQCWAALLGGEERRRPPFFSAPANDQFCGSTAASTARARDIPAFLHHVNIIDVREAPGDRG